ncbi:ABC transporter substrate-binding protein [Thiorhodococcus minor]|uniref:ABC transporter substrate-binding protein n=1 Tax=Thiorhodococcus minor TaxID=57489 RepID=A0A6M0K3V6_9GAMM|nr:ABC transporter substrate-binding protein [Thiorhodococcus minor]NEV63931.1 ABC transporter substrate-binding protein [Thiorhodococcus minor]
MRPETHAQAPLGTLRAAFERTGTPAWIMRVIQAKGLDRAEGFRLQVALTGDGDRGHRQATLEALRSGEVDFIDTDWISIGRMREDGDSVSAFHPYGRIMGGLVVDRRRFSGEGRAVAGPGFSAEPLGWASQGNRIAETPLGAEAQASRPAAAFQSHLKALAGRTIAVVSRFDKTWLLLRAYAVEQGIADPARTVDLVETGSKHEALRLLSEGEVDGAILFWHLAAEAVTEEPFELVFDALNAVESLAGEPLPTTFFVASDACLRAQPELFRAFARAFDAAVAAMRADTSVWRQGAGEMALNGLAQPLRTAWLRRIGLAWPGQLRRRLDEFSVTLKGYVGAEAMGLDALPEGTFAQDFFTRTEVAR